MMEVKNMRNYVRNEDLEEEIDAIDVINTIKKTISKGKMHISLELINGEVKVVFIECKEDKKNANVKNEKLIENLNYIG